MADRLDGKIAIITGGNNGIGLAAAKRFATESPHVYIAGRRSKALKHAENETDCKVIGIQADSANRADLDRIDVLSANTDGSIMLPLGQINEVQIGDTFGGNVKSVIFTVQKALPLVGNGASAILSAIIAAPPLCADSGRAEHRFRQSLNVPLVRINGG